MQNVCSKDIYIISQCTNFGHAYQNMNMDYFTAFSDILLYPLCEFCQFSQGQWKGVYWQYRE